MKNVTLSIDVEQDCPPFLQSTRGVQEALPPLLDLLDNQGIKATFFTTGQMAERFPALVQKILFNGHELGCHGYSHRRFDKLCPDAAREEMVMARRILRQFGAPVISFRAPNLRFPEAYLRLLEEQRFRIDSSIARYKPPYAQKPLRVGNITRIPVSLTSSVLRLPAGLLRRWLVRFDDLVLFAHPWEFIDMSKTGVRLDCRFNTGAGALRNLRAIIEHLKSLEYRFVVMAERLSLLQSQATARGEQNK
ncbi:MAG: polysaccharide deacetylase family protein [Gammaproteobacteria bacterium]